MDWSAFLLSLQLGASTLVVLLPMSLVVGRALALGRFPGKGIAEALVALPLVLPPTVLGFYLLVGFGARSPLGQAVVSLTGHTLAFNFSGLLLASVLINVPFAVQPVQRAFESISEDLREAAACCGMPPWQAFLRVELPLAWPGLVSAAALTFAHTLGEFGVVLMVGGNIPGQTKVLSIVIYESVETLDYRTAHILSAGLLVFSFAVLLAVYLLNRRSPIESR